MSLSSYKKISDTEVPDGMIQISDNANAKPSRRISALAEQVFGAPPDQSQQANSTAAQPVSTSFFYIALSRRAGRTVEN